MIFRNREQAGRMLGEQLSWLNSSGGAPVLVLALPRGGVPVAWEVARALNAELDVFVVRKIGVPGQEELAMGAIASGGVIVVNEDVLRMMRIDRRVFEAAAQRQQQELDRRESTYRNGRAALAVAGKLCVLVDDGIATGASMQAAALALRRRQPASIVIAAPVAAPVVYQQFASLADRVVCVETPDDFGSVGAWYEDFTQTTDEEVRSLLSQAQLPSRPR